jgi:glycosyltransferase involved in cell wall biosynthesis
MKVAFDSRPASDPRGIGRYTRTLLAALRESPRGEVVESRDPRGCDVFHSPWIEGAALRSHVPTAVTLHDLVPLKRPGEYLRTGLRFKLRYLAVQRATRVIVPTDAVAQDAIAALRIPPDRIVVIPEAAAPVFSPRPAAEVEAVRARHRLPERYLLWVGGMQVPDPRKRVAALTRARRSLPLVLVGPTSRWARELSGAGVTGASTRSGHATSAVHLTGAVSDDDLAAIYTGAHALVFPSDDEGFGLPPLEALACGTPVAACDVPALREVLAGRVSLTDVGDLDGLVRTAEGLSRPASSPPDWTWNDAAAATWDVYEQAIDDPRPSSFLRSKSGAARQRG